MSPDISNVSGGASAANIFGNFNNTPVEPAPVLKSKPDTFEKQPEDAEAIINKAGFKKIAGILVATTLASVGITALFMKGKNKEALEIVQKKADDAIKVVQDGAEAQTRALETLKEAARQQVKDVSEAAQKQVKDVSKEAQKRVEALELMLDGKYEESYMQKLRSKMDDFKLDYNPTKPPEKPVTKSILDGKAIEFLPFSKTQNRANMKNFEIPEFKNGTRFELNLPETSIMKPSVLKKSSDFTPILNEKTTIAMKYADSVQWDENKIARDLLQNFYDGHNHTLDGVGMVFEPIAGGRYKVKISGKGNYAPDNAILLGKTSKREDAASAGNYGEGLKTTVLKILKDYGAKNVDIASDNWKVTYKAGASGVSDEKILTYSLDKVKPQNGNYVEFETDNLDLLKSLRKSVNNFYHSSNTDFKTPDFENAVFGIKTLPRGEKGSLYIAGQKFEFDGKWDGVDDATVFFKTKPPAKFKYCNSTEPELLFDPSRDRTSLNADNLKKIAKYFTDNEKTSNEDVYKALRSLENYWSYNGKIKQSPMGEMVEGIISGAISKGVNIKFPDNYISVTSNASDDLLQSLSQQGYKLCSSSFNYIGMQDLSDFMNASRNHSAFVPDAIQTKKIGLIKEALSSLSKRLKNDEFFDAKELNPKIYLFDRFNSKEAKSSGNALAEAIIKDKKSYIDGNNKWVTEPARSDGFWVDRGYLNSVSFEEFLSTALHELTHKSGGDGSAEFSYKLTDVLTKVIESNVGDSDTVQELKVIKKLWNEISKNSLNAA